MPEEQELSTRKLRFGYWVAKNRDLLKKIRFGVIIAITTACVLFFLIELIIWLTHIQETRTIEQQLNEGIVIIGEAESPEELRILRTEGLQRDDAHIDAAVLVQNGNEKWAAADVEYELQIDGERTRVEHAEILPGQQTWLAKMNVPSTNRTPTVKLLIHNVEWKKIANTSIVPEMDWQISNTQISSISSSSQANAPLTAVDFDVRNGSAYGFRNGEVITILEDTRGTIIGIGVHPINEIQSLETRHFTLRWPKRLPTSSQTTITVNVSVLSDEGLIQ